MNGLFNMDNKFFVFMGRVADLVMLNIVFLITCIPLFTIGAAVASMYEITLKMVKNQESYVLKSFFVAFKSNFKQSTIAWLIISVVYIIFYIDFRVISLNAGGVWTALYTILMAIFIFASFVVSYVFPLQAKFINPIKATFKNAFLMSIRHLPTTLVVVIFNAIFPACLLINAQTFMLGIFAFTICGFSTVAYLNAMLLIRVFEKYYPEELKEQIEIEKEL